MDNATTEAGQGGSTPRHGLAAFLADRDVECPECGFNLRGLTGECCPECSTRIQLVIAQSDALWRYRYWLIAATIGYCMGTGANCASYLVSFLQWGAYPASPGKWLTILMIAASGGLSLALLASLIRYAVRRRSPRALAQLFVWFMCAIVISCAGGVAATVLWWFF